MNGTASLQEVAQAYAADRRRGYEFDRRLAADRRAAVRSLTIARDRRDDADRREQNR